MRINVYTLLLVSFFTCVSLVSASAQCAETITVTFSRLTLNYDTNLPDNLGRVRVTFGDFIGLYQVFAISGTAYQTQSAVFDGVTLTGEVIYMFTDGSSETCTYTNGILNTALPVEFSAFEGERKENDVSLFWSTESEENNSGFTVQRSFNGNDFHKIGTIVGKGNSSETQVYDFTDTAIRLTAPTNTVYYRLLQYDFDGAMAYSEVIAVDLGLSMQQFEITKITGWNSADRTLDVYYYNPSNAIHKISYQLTDLNGRTLVQDAVYPEVGFNSFSIDLSWHRSPIYFLMMNNGKEVISEKIMLSSDF